MRNAARREARGWPEAYTLRGIPPLRAQDLPFLLFARCVPSGKADSARIINVLCMSSYSPCAPTQCSNPVVWFRLLREDNLSNLPLSLLLRRPITCTLHVAHYIFIRPAYACVIINSPIAHAECGGVRPQSRPGERCINRKSRSSSPHSHRKPPDVWRTSRPTPCATRHATVK